MHVIHVLCLVYCTSIIRRYWFMAFVSWTWILVLLVVGYLKRVLRLKAKHKNERLPPGPKGIPILGNLLMLGKSPHRDLHHLAKQFGSIMYLQLGFVPTIVVSSPQAAELFLKTHDLVFASRPFTEAAKHISYERKGLSFTEYGPYWRNIRKLCTLELLSNMKIDSFKSMRREELGLFLRSVMDAARVGATVDVSATVTSLSQDMACLMVLGDKYMNKDHEKTEFQAAVQEGMHLAAVPNVADYIPYVGALDLKGLGRRMKAVSKVFDDLFEKIIDEHLHGTKHKHQRKDFIDVMLSVMQSNNSELPIDRSNIKAVTLDMLAGSMDTTSTAIEWALAELLKNPQAMKKVQDELESVVGLERMVDESDLDNLVYLDMVIKESLRLHPVAPLLIPHESMEDCMVSSFHVPKKSRIIVNVWAIGRDPSAWPNAEKFLPERFMGSNVDLRGRDFQLLPFGSGRRGCPGLQLGLLTIRLVLAQVLHCFDWKLASSVLPSELDMDEEFGLTMPRANHLLAVPAYRLNKPLI